MDDISGVVASHPEDITPAAKQHRVVCTACRQSKVRCEGPLQGGCARCARLGLKCHRDASYRRVVKSRKIAELEAQVQDLISVVNASTKHSSHSLDFPNGQSERPQAFHSASPVPEDANRGQGIIPAQFDNHSHGNRNHGQPLQHFGLGHGSAIVDFVSPFPIFNGPVDLSLPSTNLLRSSTTPRTIHSVQLTSDQIDSLFQVFFDHYHPSLPFLDTTKSPDDYYMSSSALFWAVIGVGSRRYREDIMLFPVLSEWVTKLIWSSISSPPYTVASVQAIILVCLWPFPTSTTWNDTVVTLSSIAISMAMQVGIHRPMHAQDYLRSKATAEEADASLGISTWAAANIVAQSVGAAWGQLPTAPFDRIIDEACQIDNMFTLPDALRYKLIIQRYCNGVTKTICQNLATSSGLQLPNDRMMFTASWENDLNVLETELNALEIEHGTHVSMLDQTYAAAARLYTHSMYFFDSSRTESRKQGILKAYKSSVNFIAVMCEADSTSDFFLYISLYHLRMLLIATCILLKVLSSSYAQDTDYESGMKVFNRSMSALSRCSVANNDSAGKAGKLLAQVWHSKDDFKRQRPPELLVKSRLGASLIYDFIWTWRQEFGGVPKAYPNPSSPRIGSPESTVSHYEGFFQDASMVNLNFLNAPDWNLGLGGQMF